MEKTQKQANDIRIGFRTRVGNVVSYCESLLKERNIKTLNFSAVGGSIGTLVNVVEVLKMTNPGFYQVNRLATISYQSVEDGGVQNQRLYPKLEVKLSLEKPESEGEGFQDKIPEEDRKNLLEEANKLREERRRRIQRGGRRGGFRGGRYGYRSGPRRILRPMRGRPPMRRNGPMRGRIPMRGIRGGRTMRGRGRQRNRRGY